MLVFSPLVMPVRTKVIVRFVSLAILMIMVLPILSQTVFAQTTYVITDGEEVTVHTTFATDPADVLDEAGVELDKGDKFTTADGDGVSEINVQRSQQIMIMNCGSRVEAASYGETLGQLLERYGIPTTGNYVVSLPLDTQTYDGMKVTVDCIITMEQTFTEELAYKTSYCYDPTKPEGTQVVMVEGANGQVRRRADVTYVNSVETERTVLEETVLQPAVNKVIVVGTGTEETITTNAPAIGDGVIVTADGQVLTYSHSDQFKTTAYTHTDAGCDMITATGTTVRWGTVAVDPKVVPYGTRMFIVSNDGKYIYGIATAEDCGGGVKGKHIDLYFPTDPECWAYGVRTATVYFLD